MEQSISETKSKKSQLFQFKRENKHENPGKGPQAAQTDLLLDLSWGKRGDIIVTTLEFINLSVCINLKVVTKAL